MPSKRSLFAAKSLRVQLKCIKSENSYVLFSCDFCPHETQRMSGNSKISAASLCFQFAMFLNCLQLISEDFRKRYIICPFMKSMHKSCTVAMVQDSQNVDSCPGLKLFVRGFNFGLISAVEIVEKLKNPPENFILRPDTSTLTCESFIIKNIQECWQEDHENRPDFKFIRLRLKPMQRGL